MRMNRIVLISLGALSALGCALGSGESGDQGAGADNAASGALSSPASSAQGSSCKPTGDAGLLNDSGSGAHDSGSTADAGAPPSNDAGHTSPPDSGTGTPPPPPAPDAGVPSSGGSSPVLGGCAILPSDNPWNTRIDDPTAYPVDPNAATYATTMAPATRVHADWGDWSTDQYGIPWQVVPASQPLVPMSFDVPDESDPGPYPFPATAKIEGGGDGHVLVIQQGSCTLYETGSSTVASNGSWSAYSGAKWPLSSDALRTAGWTSADAAGLPILPGLVKVSEVQAGAIRHALRFTMKNTQQAYIHPATHASGKADATLPPMGLRLRLKASFDTSSFTGPSLVILTAMKEYGLILADNGSDWFVTGDSDDAWIPLMDQISSDLGKVTGSDFEAVKTGTVSTAGL